MVTIQQQYIIAKARLTEVINIPNAPIFLLLSHINQNSLTQDEETI